MFNLNMRRQMQVKMYITIALCVFVNFNMEMFIILGEYKLSIQNSAT